MPQCTTAGEATETGYSLKPPMSLDQNQILPGASVQMYFSMPSFMKSVKL